MAPLSVLLPADFTAISDANMTQIQAGIQEILLDTKLHVSGQKALKDSLDTNIQSLIRALAISREVDLGIREVAVSRGVDASAGPGVLAVALSVEEIGSIISYITTTISQERIVALVTNQEMASIEQEQTAKQGVIADPDWQKDIKQLTARAVSHQILVVQPDSELSIVETVRVKLPTLQPEVDNNGEICAWIYTED